MATTTIRIEDELKLRVTVAAGIAGKTPHAFILDAIATTVEQVELETEFDAIAERRWASIVATGKTVPWEAARQHLLARSHGERPQRPAAQKPEP
jgi:predicted transcriptional regulator